MSKTIHLNTKVVFEVYIEKTVEVTDDNLTFDEASEIALELAERRLKEGDYYSNVDFLHVNGRTPEFRKIDFCDE